MERRDSLTIGVSSGLWNRLGKRAVEGDSEALGELLENSRPLLLAAAKRSVSRQMQSSLGASDIVQLTCAEAYQSVARLRAGNAKQFAAWLMQLLKNNAVDVHRKLVTSKKRSKVREVHSIEWLAKLESRDLSASELMLRDEEISLVFECIDNLRSPYRELLRWSMVDGLTDDQIAEIVDRSKDAVRMQLKRATAALRREVSSKR